VFRDFAAFAGTGGWDTGQQWVGDGVGRGMEYTYAKPGLTTDDINAGNFYVGVCVSTTNMDANLGNGTFHFSALNWTLTFGEVPPQASVITGTLTNPSTNFTTGKAVEESFDSAHFDFLGPMPQGNITFAWSLPPGLTFTNGTGTLYQGKGTAGDPSNPYGGDSGPIHVAASVMPGTYTLILAVQGIAADPNYNVSAQLLVRVAPLATDALFAIMSDV